MNKTFETTLAEIRDGDALAEASDHLQSIIHAVKNTGKSGSVTVTLRLKPAKNGTGILVEDNITMTLPRADKPGTVLYATKDFRLQRDDPNQGVFDLESEKKPQPVVA